jgi:hypothetical protein
MKATLALLATCLLLGSPAQAESLSVMVGMNIRKCIGQEGCQPDVQSPAPFEIELRPTSPGVPHHPGLQGALILTAEMDEIYFDGSLIVFAYSDGGRTTYELMGACMASDSPTAATLPTTLLKIDSVESMGELWIPCPFFSKDGVRYVSHLVVGPA